jgi:uncharacterized protein (DUF2384 family)
MAAAENVIQAAGEELGLNFNEVASALGIHRRTLFRYRKHENAPSPEVRERLGKLREITQLLSEVFREKDSQLSWLYGSVPLLRGQRPIDLIRRGELDQVISILAGIHSGAYV